MTLDKITKETKWIEQKKVPRAKPCDTPTFRGQRSEELTTDGEDVVRKLRGKPED